MARIALVQFQSTLNNMEENIEKAISFIKEAAEQQVDLIVFPELFLTGYNPDMVYQQYFDYAVNVREKSDILEFFQNIAIETNMNMVIPTVTYKEQPGVLFNSAIVINRQGVIEGSYDKTHLWAGERNYFREGSEYPVFQLDFGKIGIMICYDGGFPEVSRKLALAGAELLVCTSAFPMIDKDMWDIYFKARSLENVCFTVAVNRVGVEGSLHLFGNNKVVNPRGELLLEAPIDEEAMQIVELDLDQVTAYRKEIPFLRDRKTAYTL
ncbi:nitrilase-related carbon-nitrogen hydrolase [Bacillus sp. B1-b2]|uniref:nitrilase-related carbon-nitrogen hydrolase n=1 Tax=Bacillus sp. B1-b2 TaxID=2653201 RepID=UPI001D00D37F|nr:nitrilase-related carbon-nitrogen hydrolase [Bacillus sp. B1-b2]